MLKIHVWEFHSCAYCNFQDLRWNIYSRLSLFRNRRDPQKHFEISVLRHIRFVVLRKKIFEQPKFYKWLCNLTPLIRNIYWKYCGKGKKIAPQEQFLLFSTIFCNLILDFCVKTRTRFSLRDKRLFEITEVEITRIDCIWYSPKKSKCPLFL